MPTNPVVTSLPAYVQQNARPLIANAVIGAKTIDRMTIQSGVKGSAAVNVITSDVDFGNGAACGWNPAGNHTFTQRVIATGQIKVNEAICDKAMLGKYTEAQVRIAATGKELPFEQLFTESVNKDIQSKMDAAIWQGDTGSGDENLKRFDGLLKIAGAEGGVIDVAIAAQTTKYDAILQMLGAIPATELREGTYIFADPAFVAAYNQELVAKNLFHYEAGVDYDETIIPGSRVRLVAVEGLTGTNKVFAANRDNLYYGCDMIEDSETYELIYSKDNREFRLTIEWNAGVQIAFPDRAVLGTIATE